MVKVVYILVEILTFNGETREFQQKFDLSASCDNLSSELVGECYEKQSLTAQEKCNKLLENKIKFVYSGFNVDYRDKATLTGRCEPYYYGKRVRPPRK